MPSYSYLVVEGPHDVEFIARLLRPIGFHRVKLEAELDPFFESLVPHSFPPDGDLMKRVPLPAFLKSDTNSVAIHSASGDSRIVQTVEENAALLSLSSLDAIGIFLDADSQIDPHARYSSVRNELRSRGFAFPDLPGE